MGCGALVMTAAQNCWALLKPAAPIGIATLVPSGTFLDRDRDDHVEPQPGRVRCKRGTHGETLREAVNEQHREDQH